MYQLSCHSLVGGRYELYPTYGDQVIVNGGYPIIRKSCENDLICITLADRVDLNQCTSSTEEVKSSQGLLLCLGDKVHGWERRS
jgi:hypothetical protein